MYRENLLWYQQQQDQVNIQQNESFPLGNPRTAGLPGLQGDAYISVM